jgi:hypothetical protein
VSNADFAPGAISVVITGRFKTDVDNRIITTYLRLRLLVISGVAVEKLAHFDFAKTASRQEAL